MLESMNQAGLLVQGGTGPGILLEEEGQVRSHWGKEEGHAR